jgi:hypothetical protein
MVLPELHFWYYQKFLYGIFLWKLLRWIVFPIVYDVGCTWICLSSSIPYLWLHKGKEIDVIYRGHIGNIGLGNQPVRLDMMLTIEDQPRAIISPSPWSETPLHHSVSVPQYPLAKVASTPRLSYPFTPLHVIVPRIVYCVGGLLKACLGFDPQSVGNFSPSCYVLSKLVVCFLPHGLKFTFNILEKHEKLGLKWMWARVPNQYINALVVCVSWNVRIQLQHPRHVDQPHKVHECSDITTGYTTNSWKNIGLMSGLSYCGTLCSSLS